MNGIRKGDPVEYLGCRAIVIGEYLDGRVMIQMCERGHRVILCPSVLLPAGALPEPPRLRLVAANGVRLDQVTA